MPSFLGKGVPEYPGMDDLWSGSEITAATANPQALLPESKNLDAAIVPVGGEIRGLIRNRVLTAQFFLNRGECVSHFRDLEGNIGAPTSSIGDAFQHLVSVMAALAGQV